MAVRHGKLAGLDLDAAPQLDIAAGLVQTVVIQLKESVVRPDGAFDQARIGLDKSFAFQRHMDSPFAQGGRPAAAGSRLPARHP